MFPKSGDFDYRGVFDENHVSKLKDYFDKDLISILTNITNGKAKK